MNANYWTALATIALMCIQCIDAENRAKRQAVGDAGDALVDAVFQIPIQTLTAVGTLVKSSRPVIMQVRQRIQQTLATPPQPHRFSFPAQSSQNSAQSQQGNRRISSVYQPTSSYNRLYQQSGSGQPQPQLASATTRPSHTRYQHSRRQSAHKRPAWDD